MATYDKLAAVFGTAWHTNAVAVLTQLAASIDAGGDNNWPIAGAAQAAITDASGGTASPTAGVIATLATQTFSFYSTLILLANSQFFEVDPGFAGLVTAANFRTRIAVTTGSKAATATAQIAATNLTTGGVISLTSAACTPTGTVVAGTAVTAQAFTKSQSIGFEITSVTAFAEGDGYLELTVVNTDLANAIATILAQTNGLRAALVSAGIIKGSA